MGPNDFADDYVIEDFNFEDFSHDELERDHDEPYEGEWEQWVDHDDMYDVESALGSAGWGTDEWHGGYDE